MTIQQITTYLINRDNYTATERKIIRRQILLSAQKDLEDGTDQNL